MRLADLQKNWDAFGEQDALRAILVQREAWAVDEFFKTGEQYVAALVDRLNALNVTARGSVLDFGCGVGRLTQAFAAHFSECCGVDIAPSMIARAMEFNRFGGRVRYITNRHPDLRLFRTASCDLVFSVIVLQHMEPPNAMRYIREFFRVCCPEGAVVFQVPSRLARAELPRGGYAAEIGALVPECVVAGSAVPVSITIRNASPITWNNDYATGIRIGYRWLREPQVAVSSDHICVPLPQIIQSGETIKTTLHVDAPTRKGRHALEVELVHEGVTRFSDRGSRGSRSVVEVLRPNAITQWHRLAKLGAERVGRRRRAVREPEMEMHGIPQEQVLELIRSCGATVVAVDETNDAEAWQSFRYVATKGRG